jgi:sensor histidine kinase YesM
MIATLADMFRYQLQHHIRISDCRDEINFVKQYLELEKLGLKTD